MSTSASPVDVSTASWFPLAIVMMCQIQVSFNAFNREPDLTEEDEEGLTLATPRSD